MLLAILWTLGLTFAGQTVLSLLKITELRGLQRYALGYWIGYILYGYSLFFSGITGNLDIISASAFFVLALPSLLKPNFHWPRLDTPQWFFVLFIIVALLNLPGALVPPAEGDSLAYHFSLARHFAEAGEIMFEPIAITYASPLLSQMLNTGAYIIGGEKTMILHNWFAGIMAAIAVYSLAKCHLRISVAWIFAILVYTIPAVTYGAVSGNVEVKLMGIVAMAAFAVVYYARSEQIRWLIITALLAGGTMGMKYFGMFSVVAFGVVVLLVLRNMKLNQAIIHSAIYVAVALIISSQWYLWNFYHTGDPVFPALFSMLGHSGWSEAQAQSIQTLFFDGELMMPRNLLTMLQYPFDVTINGDHYDAGRTGLGALFLMALLPALYIFFSRFPFKVWKARIGAQEIYILLFILFYLMWFFIGVSGRGRHLLPFLPLIMLPTYIWGTQIFARAKKLPRILISLSIVAVLSVQVAMLVMVNSSAFAVVFKKITVEEYLNSYVPDYAITDYLNKNLLGSDKIMHTELRTVNYYLHKNDLHAEVPFQEVIPLAYAPAVEIFNAMLKEDITHWVTIGNPMDIKQDSPTAAHDKIRELTGYGCLRPLSVVPGVKRMSRTISAYGDYKVNYHIFKLIKHCAG